VFIPDSAFGIVTLRNAEEIWLDSMQVREVILFRPLSRPPLERPCLPICLVPEDLSCEGGGGGGSGRDVKLFTVSCRASG